MTLFTNNVPKILEKLSIKPIRSYSSISVHEKYGIHHLLFAKKSSKHIIILLINKDMNDFLN